MTDEESMMDEVKTIVFESGQIKFDFTQNRASSIHRSGSKQVTSFSIPHLRTARFHRNISNLIFRFYRFSFITSLRAFQLCFFSPRYSLLSPLQRTLIHFPSYITKDERKQFIYCIWIRFFFFSYGPASVLAALAGAAGGKRDARLIYVTSDCYFTIQMGLVGARLFRYVDASGGRVLNRINVQHF